MLDKTDSLISRSNGEGFWKVDTLSGEKLYTVSEMIQLYGRKATIFAIEEYEQGESEVAAENTRA